MIVKSLLAGIVLAGMAGGGVYYGLSPIESEPMVEQRIKPIAPKKLTVKKFAEAKAHPHPERKSKIEKNNEGGVTKSWISQYVDKAVKQDIPDKTDVDRDDAKQMRGVKAKAEKMKAEARKAKEMARAEKEKMRHESAKGQANGRFVVKDSKPASAIGTMESFDTIGIIMREAEVIGSVDLRDRAYLNVVDYALMHGYFGKAKAALAEISQPELRETARSRIAVKYAGTGNPEAAFDLIDGVEMTDFKDAMRIQIIEALIAAESLKGHDH